MKVFLHSDFVFGDENDKSITDLSFFSDKEVELLYDFMDKVHTKQYLCGTNKKSSDTNLVLQKTHVEKYNIWHYHINHKKKCTLNSCLLKVKCLNIGIEKTNFECAEIIHYLIDSSKNYLIIFAYSKKHTKGDFPLLYKDPLWRRAVFKKNIIDYEYINVFFEYCAINDLKPCLIEYNKFINTIK